MNATLSKLLAERKPGKKGIHGTGDWSTPSEYYERQVPEWLACDFSYVKLLAGGDSQVNFCRWLKEHHCNIIPIIRLYFNDAPANHVAPDLVKPYIDQGVVLFESPANEFYFDYENSWHSTVMDNDKLKAIAHGWGLFADSVLRAGGVPTTPAMEPGKWHILAPFYDILTTDYKDVLRQSVLAFHPRTLNHPISYNADADCYQGWEMADRYIAERMDGKHIPILNTESGPEPSWHQDTNFDAVSPGMHAIMVRDMIVYPKPDHFLADCFWLWEGSGAWAGASWKNNRTHMGGKDLPVVNMLETWRPEAATPDLSDETILAIGLAHPSAISVNPDAMFYKVAQAGNFGHPECSEWRENGWAWQKWERGITACKEGDWSNVRAIPRP